MDYQASLTHFEEAKALFLQGLAAYSYLWSINKIEMKKKKKLRN